MKKKSKIDKKFIGIIEDRVFCHKHKQVFGGGGFLFKRITNITPWKREFCLCYQCFDNRVYYIPKAERNKAKLQWAMKDEK